MSCSCKYDLSCEQGREKLQKLLAGFDLPGQGLIGLLQKTQEILGYLPCWAMEDISGSTGVPEAEIYGVVTFYSQFRLSPIGRNHIKVCCGTACHVGGADAIAEETCRVLCVEEGATTADGEFTVERVACLGCCSLAPVIMVNDTVHGRLKPSVLASILEPCRAGENITESEAAS